MKYVIANWKMKMSLGDIEKWVDNFSENFNSSSNVTTIIAPTYIHLPYVKAQLTARGVDEGICLAVQNVSANDKGSHTGEVGAFQVKDFCNYVIVGHSERAEGPALISAKRDIALEYGLTPIVCFSSPSQAEFFFKEGVILAWEDPENISSAGSYKEKPLGEIEKAAQVIRRSLPEEASLLYGGSVNRNIVTDLVGVEGLDGVLVGHASLSSEHFLELIKAYEVS